MASSALALKLQRSLEPQALAVGGRGGKRRGTIRHARGPTCNHPLPAASAYGSNYLSVLTIAIACTVLLISGCAPSGRDISNEYGRKVGRTGATSVNGTNVFVRMFREGGARVKTCSRLGRTIDKAEVVVWFPDRYSTPSQKSRDYLEDWLTSGSGRTLIYVGRDFNATARYWEYVLEHASEDQPEQYLEARKKLAEARVADATQRGVNDPKEDCDWFALNRSKNIRQVDSLSGPLSRGVDASNVDIELATELERSDSVVKRKYDHRGEASFEPLLSTRGEMLVGKFTRESWYNNQIIVVSNGSWLLNLPLVNHEHRRLAGNLISECGNADKVVFLESGPGEPPVSNQEPNRHHGMAAFTVWPINCILMHLLALGVVFCFTVFPIFGRPRNIAETEASDFGHHIFAIGELMSRTQDREYAMRCRENYQQRVADKSSTATVPPSPQGSPGAQSLPGSLTSSAAIAPPNATGDT